MIFHRILLLILLGVSLIKSDPIGISLKVRCEFNVKWCANLEIYEEDNTFPTNDFLKKESFCTTDPFKEFNYAPMNLDGDVSPSYEFNVLFHHNCTQGGVRSWACYYSPEPLAFCPVDGEQAVSMDVGIGNKWNSKECWPRFADPNF
ncbi:unnamed protein product [Caenorhabditis nigoni]|uniref:Uncharacterized protein n=1 Tax=Caenorhabditis nigoni TaxID=1611254 RepID=A0A2G5SQ45_9PELO|nr:hypothetical protein B9Z55_023371 [Caenorhabditis nigoni]